MACGNTCLAPAELESPGCDESGLQGLAGRLRGQGGGHSAPRLVAREAEEPERGEPDVHTGAALDRGSRGACSNLKRGAALPSLVLAPDSDAPPHWQIYLCSRSAPDHARSRTRARVLYN
jgi:hypothetical protein